MPMKWKVYGIAILLTEAVGALSGWLARDGTRLYATMIEKPPFSPPGVVFPVAWALLYALMGIGAARVWSACLRNADPGTAGVLGATGVQLPLEPDFFQSPGLWVCVSLAGGTMGADLLDDPDIPPGGSVGGGTPDPVPCLGHLCGLSESGCLGAEPVIGF